MKNDDEIIDDSEGSFSETPPSDEGKLTQIHLLCLAKCILGGVAIIFIGACISELWIPDNAVFEACKVTLPSLATLVIGYYFGSTK